MHLVAVTAAIVAVMLIATGASLWHIDAPGSAATCPICHLAHVSVFNALPAELVSVNVIVTWFLPADESVCDAKLVLQASSPRAPPASIQ